MGMLGKILYRLRKNKWLKNGFTNENVGHFMYELEEEYKNKKEYDRKTIKFSEKYGFFPSTVKNIGINESNYKDYLSDYDYARLYPLDGKFHFWIDNKITLKYLLGDLSYYMPEYYYQIDSSVGIIKLMDCPEQLNNSVESIIELLKTKKELAIKSIYGYEGKNFLKVYLKNNKIYINDEVYNEQDFERFINTLDGYIIMEYLNSTGLLADIYPKTVNSIRYIIGVDNGKQYKINSLIKIGNKASGYTDNFARGGIICPIDENGNFELGYIKENGIIKTIDKHPESGQILKGKIEEWNEIEEMVQNVIKRLPQLIHLGFDFAISDKGIKILEINDMSSLIITQPYKPLLKNKNDNFYLKKLQKLKERNN